jgi:hypothetical protein
VRALNTGHDEAASTSPTNALTLDANPKVPVNATFDVAATLMGTAVSSKSTVFSSGSGGFTFPSGNSTVTDALGEAVVTAKAPATPGTYVITATIPALNLTATITIQVTGMALYTATKAASGWKMSDVGISDAQQVLVGSGYYWPSKTAWHTSSGPPPPRLQPRTRTPPPRRPARSHSSKSGRTTAPFSHPARSLQR